MKPTHDWQSGHQRAAAGTLCWLAYTYCYTPIIQVYLFVWPQMKREEFLKSFLLSLTLLHESMKKYRIQKCRIVQHFVEMFVE